MQNTSLCLLVIVIAINLCNYLLCITIPGEWLNQLQNYE